MSRPRTATAILDARGAFKAHPERKREDPKVDSAFPDVAPSELDPLEVKWWHRIRKMVPAAVLTGADQALMIQAAALMAEYMSDRRGMATSRMAHMTKVLGLFGLSPSDRARLAATPEDDDGDF